MKKAQNTRMVFILDESGSMAPLQKATIDGFNGLIEEQKTTEGACTVRAVAFSNDTRTMISSTDLRNVRPLNARSYRPGGCTALYDAVGTELSRALAQTDEDDPYDRTVFVIMTDGYENASQHYTRSQVRHLIKKAKKKYDWTFLFLGANLDAAQAAGDIGIEPDYAAEYLADEEGTQLTYSAVSEAIVQVREMARPVALGKVRADSAKRGSRRR